MTDPPRDLRNVQHDITMRSIGHCLIAWAQVEYQLGDMFLRYHGREPQVATLVWDSIVSLDARITMLQRLMKLRFPQGVVHDDTVLLLNECRRLYKQRNEIAHATLILTKEKRFVLEPFFVIGNPKQQLDLSDVQARSVAFAMLSIALGWLQLEMDPPGATLTRPPPTSEQQLPDLVRELRNAESQRRKEQSERQKLLGHALKLQAEGRLPDWPPAAEGGS